MTFCGKYSAKKHQSSMPRKRHEKNQQKNVSLTKKTNKLNHSGSYRFVPKRFCPLIGPLVKAAKYEIQKP